MSFFSDLAFDESILNSDLSIYSLWKTSIFSSVILIGLTISPYINETSFLISPIFLILIVCSPLLFQIFYLNKIKFAVVLKNSQVYEGPSKIYSKVFELEEGSKILLGQKSGKWYLISSPPQMRGWVQEQVIGKL